MRHNNKINQLGRTNSHRKAMLANMASSLILHKRIKTTIAKAKVLRTFVEPLITKSKNDTTHNRRVVFSILQNKDAVSELFREVAQKIVDRPGGYTRILKIGARSGDNAQMCIIELVDYNYSLLEAKEADKKSSRRSRRGKRKPSGSQPEIATGKDQTKITEEISNPENADNITENEIVEKKEESVAETKKVTEAQKEESANNINTEENKIEPPEASDNNSGETEEKDDAVENKIKSEKPENEIAVEKDKIVEADKDEKTEEKEDEGKKDDKQ